MIKHPLFLIFDAMSQVFRAYYAVRGLSNSQGVPTNATYGFALMLNRVLEKFPPEYIAMVFDSSEPTVRHIEYPLYKANRDKLPTDLGQQIPDIKRFCEAMRVPILEVPGQEADDVIGTVARRARERQLYPVIVTMDKDMMQLVDETLVLNTSRDDMLIGPEQVKELFGVTPAEIPDLLGLWGDSSDNVPGAPGIGEKGAKALIQRFGSVAACLDHAGEVTSKRQRESLQENRELIELSRHLVTIDTNVAVELDWDSFKTQPPDKDALVPLLRELEFTSMLKEQLQAGTESLSIEVVTTDEVPDVHDYFAFELSLDRIKIWTGDGVASDVSMGAAASLLSDPNIRKVTHDVKAALLALRRHDVTLDGPVDDPMLMGYLLMPNRGKYGIGDLASELFGQSSEGEAVAWIHRISEELRPRVLQEVESVYTTIEMPLVPVLADMERLGILLDVSVLETMSTEMGRQLEGLTARIYELAGTEFNINSPKQLGEILFEKLNLPHSRKLRKSGQYSTAVEVLEDLAKIHEMPRLLLDYRKLTKFKSTYVDVLPKLIDPETGRLHTSFNQAGAATGRLSSSNPNLQNIPIRTEMGRAIRGAFVPREGTTMLSADYSQVELRILAHLSGDEGLIEAFLQGADIHRSTAAEVLGLPAEEITSEQRGRAKAVNFGIVYGQTPFGLAQQLGIARDEAEKFIDRYFNRYPGVRDYIENSLVEARETGMTRTLFGRHRQIPEINARNGMRRNMAERMAINAPIQGTAADIIKLAMIRIARELAERRRDTRMVLQVHDELIFEVPEGEMDIVDQIREWMAGVVELAVPLVVDTKTGPNWKDLS